jgi:intein/homing endonuclease
LYSSNAKVLDPFGNVVDVEKNVVTKRVPTIKLITKKGYSIEGTTKQALRVINPDCKMEWKNLEDLEEGDHVALSVTPQDSADVDLSACARKTRNRHRYGSRVNKEATLPTKMTSRLAKILGYLVSEGGVTQRNTFTFTNTDKRLVKDYVKCIKRVFKVTPSVSLRKERTRTGKKVWDVTVNSVFIRDYLSLLGLDYVRSKDKSVPWAVLQSPLKIAKYFLRVYMDGDGCNPGNLGIFSSSSSEVLHQIQNLLLRFGIISHLAEPRPTKDGSFHSGQVRIHSVYWDLYRDKVGFGVKDSYVPTCKRLAARGIPYVAEFVKKCTSKVVTNGGWVGGVRKSVSLSTFLGKNYGHAFPKFVDPFRLGDYLQQTAVGEVFPQLAKRLKELVDSGFVWDEVVSLERTTKRVVTYDVCLSSVGVLPHALVANGFVVHNSFSGQTVNLEYDKAGPLGEVMSRWEAVIWERLPSLKMSIYRKAAGSSMVAVRPGRLNINNRVYRAGRTNNAVADFPGILNLIGLGY